MGRSFYGRAGEKVIIIDTDPAVPECLSEVNEDVTGTGTVDTVRHRELVAKEKNFREGGQRPPPRKDDR